MVNVQLVVLTAIEVRVTSSIVCDPNFLDKIGFKGSIGRLREMYEYSVHDLYIMETYSIARLARHQGAICGSQH